MDNLSYAKGEGGIIVLNLQETGRNIKEIREAKGLSQEKAAEKANRRLSYSESPAIARGELIALQRIVKSAAAQTTGIAKSHYENLQALIEDALSNK